MKAVRDAFIKFTAEFEGRLPFLYLDIEGLVTVAIGNLVDPVDLALQLPFKKPDGTLATKAEIRSAWKAVKARTDLCLHGGGAYAHVTDLRLSDADIDKLVLAKFDANEHTLASRFDGWSDLPADAVLAIHSMAWAMGANFHWPKFHAAINARDFRTAANESHMNDTRNRGLRPRNSANFQLLQNAAVVRELQLDPRILYYPGQPTITQETFRNA